MFVTQLRERTESLGRQAALLRREVWLRLSDFAVSRAKASPDPTQPGGLRCLYCGAAHSKAVDCRLPCETPGCDGRGMAWRTDEKGGLVSPVRCMTHRPTNLRGWRPLPVPPPVAG